jgi:hypothetical protein
MKAKVSNYLVHEVNDDPLTYRLLALNSRPSPTYVQGADLSSVVILVGHIIHTKY